VAILSQPITLQYNDFIINPSLCLSWQMPSSDASLCSKYRVCQKLHRKATIECALANGDLLRWCVFLAHPAQCKNCNISKGYSYKIHRIERQFKQVIQNTTANDEKYCKNHHHHQPSPVTLSYVVQKLVLWVILKQI